MVQMREGVQQLFQELHWMDQEQMVERELRRLLGEQQEAILEVQGGHE
jgi:hypothetical protein